MARLDSDLDRLLMSAASAPKESPAQVPFGFIMRIVALRHPGVTNDSRELGRFVRRIAVAATMITVVATAFTYQQISENDEIDEPLTNDYAIADSAIQAEFLQ